MFFDSFITPPPLWTSHIQKALFLSKTGRVIDRDAPPTESLRLVGSDINSQLTVKLL
jgi:hypothetical protein